MNNLNSNLATCFAVPPTPIIRVKRFAEITLLEHAAK